MKILLACVDFPPAIGGVAAHVYELGRELVRQGHRVQVASFRIPKSTPPRETVAGMEVYRVSPGPRILWRRVMRRAIKTAVAAFSPDVIHVHGIRPLTPSRGLGVPVVFTNHTSGFLKRVERGGFARKRVGAMMAHLSHTISPSQELVDAGIAVGYPAERSSYIPNGVDVERFHPDNDGAALRKEWGVSADDVVVLAARRMVPKNGMKYLAQAAKGFLDERVKLVMVGDGEELPLVRKTLQADGVADRVVLAGNRGNAEMPAHYAASDLVVLPSLKEATSITGLEAMATGKPLVGTRVGGIPDLIAEDENGVLVDPADPDSLASGVRRMIDDADFRQRAGKVSRQRVEDHFSWRVIAARTADVYRGVV